MNKRKRHADRKTPTRLPKRLVKARQHQVLGMYASGKTPQQIAAVLDMRLTDVTRDLRIAVDELVTEYAKPTPQQTFVRYAAFQFGIISELKKASSLMLKDKRNRQYNAVISSLRAQSDIFDKIMDKGHEYGVIQRKKASGALHKQSRDIREDLRVEIVKLTRLLDEIDDSTQAQAVRASQTTITYTVRVRKPLRTPFGIARAIPDWKYRQSVYDEQGNEVPLSRLSPDQRKLIAGADIDARLHAQLVVEQRKLAIQEQQGAVELPPAEQPQPTQQVDSPQPAKPQPATDEQPTWIVLPQQL